MKTVIKYSFYFTVLAFVAVYSLQAMDNIGVKPEAIEKLESNNPKVVETTKSYVKYVEKKAKNFEWEKFKEQIQEALGLLEEKVENVSEVADQAIDESDKIKNEVEEIVENLDGAVESQVNYEETIDDLEAKIQEIISINKNKDKQRLRLVNAKKIARLEKRLFRTKDPVKREKLRELIKALSGEF